MYDFSGWATRNNLRCSDGRTIMKDAFKDCDGKRVPMVWNHDHNDPLAVLGHALLKNKPEGVYAYCKFNDTESGQNAKMLRCLKLPIKRLWICLSILKNKDYRRAIRRMKVIIFGKRGD